MEIRCGCKITVCSSLFDDIGNEYIVTDITFNNTAINKTRKMRIDAIRKEDYEKFNKVVN